MKTRPGRGPYSSSEDSCGRASRRATADPPPGPETIITHDSTRRVRLRPHHLLCMLTFAGEGYSAEFVANFETIVRRIGAGEAIEMIDGPDDVCAPLEASDDTHCGNATVGRRDRTALLALAEAGIPVAVRPLVIDRERVAELRAQFAGGAIRAACRGCDWFDLCTRIAAGGFAASALDP